MGHQESSARPSPSLSNILDIGGSTRYNILFEILKSPICRHSRTSRYDILPPACNQSQQESYLVDIHSSIGRLPLVPGSIVRVQNKGEKKSQDNRNQFSKEQLWCSSLERILLSLDNPDKSGEEVEAAKEESKTAEDQGGENSVLPPTEDRREDDEEGQKEASRSCVY